jgi:hypothetical protein
VRRLLRIRTSDVERLLQDASRPAPSPTGSWTDVPPEGRRMR